VRPIPAALRRLGSRSAVVPIAALALAVAVAVTLVGAVPAPAPADAQPVPVGPPGVEPRPGTATFTDLTGPGACSFLGEPADNLHVGLSTFEYGTATPCGGYLDVTGPSGTARVKVTDHCRRCDPGLIDVTRTAFARFADVGAGRVPVTYRLVRNPPLAEAISLRVKSGSSRWWLQIQALDHGNPLARFEARQDGAWRRLVHTADNYWAAEDPGLGDGPFTVRITDVFDQQVTIDGVQLAPGVVQPTGARLYPTPGRSAGSSPSATEPPATTTTTRGALDGTGLAPPLSIVPGATRSRSGDDDDGDDDGGDDRDESAAAAASDEGDDDGEGAALWPLLLVLAAAVAAARVLVRGRARARAHDDHLRQGLRPTPQ
jgi:expansin